MIIKIGDRGQSIKQIQTLLGIEADGIFGPVTERAVREYQSKHNIEVDGIVGPITWNEMFGEAEPSGMIELKKSRRKIKMIILHCSATQEGKDYTVAQIRQWHLKRGFNDIGYNYVIYRDGSIHTGRDVDQSGAHTIGHNHDSIGICYVGGVDLNFKAKDTRTAAQTKSLHILVQKLMDMYGLKITDVYGHRDFANKACPSFETKIFREEHKNFYNTF